MIHNIATLQRCLKGGGCERKNTSMHMINMPVLISPRTIQTRRDRRITKEIP